MNRRDLVSGARRVDDSALKRKEKENRKLQLELRSEREKLNSTIIKYQKEISEMQAVSAKMSYFYYVMPRPVNLHGNQTNQQEHEVVALLHFIHTRLECVQVPMFFCVCSRCR